VKILDSLDAKGKRVALRGRANLAEADRLPFDGLHFRLNVGVSGGQDRRGGTAARDGDEQQAGDHAETQDVRRHDPREAIDRCGRHVSTP
jgi:hypothetical protein